MNASSPSIMTAILKHSARSLAERLAALPRHQRDTLITTLSPDEQAALTYAWRDFWARPDQLAPPGDWAIWLVLAGRGFGKTRTGAEWVRERVATGAKRIAVVAETAADARDVMVEGESGLLSVYPPDEAPLYQPSKRRISWPNGAIATLYNATEPDQLRGPQHDTAWCDELAKWRRARDTWDQLQFGMRRGDPRIIVTTTPRPIELIKALVAGTEGRVKITRGRTSDNRANLAPGFIERIEGRYSGTRLGRQELEGEILGNLPGALWQLSDIDTYRVHQLPELERIVVAVDPAVTAGDDSDESGVIVAGVAKNDGYIIEDASARLTPLQWARRAVTLYDKYEADAVVIETNQGGDMVKHTLQGVRRHLPIIEVRASRGKHVRAEPIAALYEQGRIHHAGSFPELENQLCQMTAAGYEGENSPDRLDALVWALTELFPRLVQRASRNGVSLRAETDFKVF